MYHWICERAVRALSDEVVSKGVMEIELESERVVRESGEYKSQKKNKSKRQRQREYNAVQSCAIADHQEKGGEAVQQKEHHHVNVTAVRHVHGNVFLQWA